MISTEESAIPLREPADLLAKLVLPVAWRPDVLRALASMGIDASTLFPGLDGVGRQASLSLGAGLHSLRDVWTDWIT
jgi:hypothetical protein